MHDIPRRIPSPRVDHWAVSLDFMLDMMIQLELEFWALSCTERLANALSLVLDAEPMLARSFRFCS